jgi:hypothetical protein
MIIGINGRIGSGKDAVGEIIQKLMLTTYGDHTWKIKKFADKLKDTVCLIIGCTRKQLEDRDFKEKELGEEWWYYRGEQKNKLFSYIEAEDANKKLTLVKLTPRLLLQLLGTEAGREIIHPDIWVNSLMSECVEAEIVKVNGGTYQSGDLHVGYPNWIITDVRFPNELDAIRNKDGLTIRIERYCQNSLEDYLVTYPDKEVSKKAIQIVQDWGFNKHESLEAKLKELPESKGYIENEHTSETALDDSDFDYTIKNRGTMEELVQKVRSILIKEEILKL